METKNAEQGARREPCSGGRDIDRFLRNRRANIKGSPPSKSTAEPLRGLPVMDAMGKASNFRHLTMQHGVPRSIIELIDQNTVALPHNLGYDPMPTQWVADLPYNQLHSMPTLF